jgi:uncharacterized protein YgiB involved in biofilm formation
MRKLRPLLLASVAAIALAACEDSNDLASQFIRDEASCASTDNPGACRQALLDAREAHGRTAPAFASLSACEDRFGAANCQPLAAAPAPEQLAAAGTETREAQQVQQAGGSFFMPMLMGYMMGRMMGGAMAAQPLYRDTANRAYSGTKPMGRFDDRLMPPPRQTAAAASAMPRGPQQTANAPVQERRAGSAVERGGFGRSGMGRVSGG